MGFGLGFVTRDNGGASHTGPGFNLEMAVGITRDIELGFRTGLRPTDDARFTHADEYGRLFDRETDPYAAGNGAMANPEFRLRGALTRGQIAEVALEGRVVLPFATDAPIGNHTSVGLQAGLPIAIHAGRVARFDTGIYIPIAFYDPAVVGFRVPLAVWFQVSNKVWLGPITGLYFTHIGGRQDFDRTDLLLGFGLGVSLSRNIDLKTMFLLPRVNDRDGAHVFGAGIGLQFRIE